MTHRTKNALQDMRILDGHTHDALNDLADCQMDVVQWYIEHKETIREALSHMTAAQEAPAVNTQELLNPDMPAQELLLVMGELNVDEILVARAAIRWANSKVSK